MIIQIIMEYFKFFQLQFLEVPKIVGRFNSNYYMFGYPMVLKFKVLTLKNFFVAV